MSSFTNALILWDSEGPNPRMHVVVTKFRYWHGHVGSGWYTDIPRGFRTNLISIPGFILWVIKHWMVWLIPLLERANQAAVLHDWLYGRAWVHSPEGKVAITRLDADRAFNEAMTVLEVETWIRRTLYVLIRLFGWYRWGKIRWRQRRRRREIGVL